MSPPAEKPAPSAAEEPIEGIEDVEHLLALAKGYRAGKEGLPRDLQKCFDCYRAASKLGSAEADYALAVFHLTGTIVEQDLKEGATRLRAAADGGVLPAKVYLGNLYELGIHFKADPEKADVWYRSAARSAGVKDEPDSPDGMRALARLGCVRHALALSEDPTAPEQERQSCLAKARTLGHELKLREDRRAEQDLAALDGEAAKPEPAPARAAQPEPAARKTPAVDPAAERARERRRARRGAELTALGFAALIAAVGLGASFAAHAGALAWHAQSGPLPLFGQRVELVLPSVVVLAGVLPALLVYRVDAFAIAFVAAAASSAIGWRVWQTAGLSLLDSQIAQSIGFGLAGFLLALLVLGLTRGAARRGKL